MKIDQHRRSQTYLSWKKRMVVYFRSPPPLQCLGCEMAADQSDKLLVRFACSIVVTLSTTYAMRDMFLKEECYYGLKADDILHGDPTPTKPTGFPLVPLSIFHS